MIQKYSLCLFICLCFFSCKQSNEQKHKSHEIQVVEAIGYVVPKDSMVMPNSVLIDEKKIKKIPAGNPIVIKTNTNIHYVGETKKVIIQSHNTYTPGKDNFKLPQKVLAKGKVVTAGIAEVSIAKDMANKDQNPFNFSSFGKLQGLKNNNINCLLEDSHGNIWFGTIGGGATRYDGKYFTHFTTKEGLSSNDIRSVLEDKNGNIWFGTVGGGACRYDGINFTHFTDKEGLNNNTVWSILEDKSGNIWFGTEEGGVNKYDGKYFTYFTTNEGLSSNDVRSLEEDKSGNLWFGTASGGVNKFDRKCFVHFKDKDGLSNNDVRTILKDKQDNLWFGTYGGGVSKYDGNSFVNFTDKDGLGNNDIRSILEDKSGNIWFGTAEGGISKYDGKCFTTFTDKEGLSNNVVLSIIEDKYGYLWFGTYGGGVNKSNGKMFTHFTTKEGLTNNAVFSILEDRYRNIWFGTSGGGIGKYDGKSFTNFTTKEGLCSNVVLCILEDKQGNLWFGTYGGGVSKYDGKTFINFTKKEGLISNDISCILQDKSGDIWFGTVGSGVCKYNGVKFTHYTIKEGLSSNDILSILEDKKGNIWIGTYGGGVTMFDGKNFTHFTDKEGLSNNNIFSILEDKAGNLWFGTYGNGSNMYDGKYFTHFTENEGLSNNNVFSLLEDNSGDIWFGTRFSFSKLNVNRLSALLEKTRVNKNNVNTINTTIFKNYSYDDGFLGIGCNGNSIYEAKDGAIWIGANDRLTVYHPEGNNNDIIPPNIQLTGIDLFNEPIPWSNLIHKKDTALILGNGIIFNRFKFDSISKWYGLPFNLSLSYDNNQLTFNFIGITMAQSKHVKYQYKLDGIDDNWSAITNRTDAPYGNIQPGSYTFKVKAMNSEGYWSNEFKYAFVIRPPWWQTWWFRVLVGLITISSIWYYIKSRERKLVYENEKLEKTVEERTAEVIEQKNIIEEKHNEIVEEKKIIETQKHIIEEKHKEITDSINYAERIQRSFMATKEFLDENLKNYFVFFQPKDVVSGDFYWAYKLLNNQFVLVTADSTGHGVPGAIMSLLNITSLESAIKDGYTSPSEILNATRTSIINRLKKDGSVEGGKDGMDASILIFDFENNKLFYSAANNPVWIIRQNELIELKPDKMPVGKHDKESESFTQHEVELQKGDAIYTLTDGFPDQFGGEKGKKFMSKKLKELLQENSHLQMQEQKLVLENTFKKWVGDLEQIDDVTIIGIRI